MHENGQIDIYIVFQMNGTMVFGIRINVSMARRQPSFDGDSGDASGNSWSTLGGLCSFTISQHNMGIHVTSTTVKHSLHWLLQYAICRWGAVVMR